MLNDEKGRNITKTKNTRECESVLCGSVSGKHLVVKHAQKTVYGTHAHAYIRTHARKQTHAINIQCFT